MIDVSDSIHKATKCEHDGDEATYVTIRFDFKIIVSGPLAAAWAALRADRMTSMRNAKGYICSYNAIPTQRHCNIMSTSAQRPNGKVVIRS